MKNSLLLFSLALSIALNAAAQVVVLENGQTLLGKTPTNMYINPDATLNICDISNNINPNDDRGVISFGQGTNTMIGGSGYTGTLILKAKNHFALSSGNDTFALTFSHQSQIFNFEYSLKAPTYLTSSDIRYKKNVASMDGMYAKLMDVNPVSYNLSYPIKTDSAGFTHMTLNATENITDDRVHFGFVAQDIQKIYPNLVVEDEDGILSIDYDGFIPVLVDAYKNLASKVQEQEVIITELLRSISPSRIPASVGSLVDNRAVLRQNQPNPFNSSTTIECTLPENVSSASLYIYDMQGKQIKNIDIRERGTVNIVVEASSLSPGMYIYALIADGNEIDSKRMILTN